MLILSTATQLESLKKTGDRIQQRINNLYFNATRNSPPGKYYRAFQGIHHHLLTVAEASHAQFPQYENHWDKYSLGIVDVELKTSLGVCAKRDDIVLYYLRSERKKFTWVMFSVRTFSEVSITRNDSVIRGLYHPPSRKIKPQ